MGHKYDYAIDLGDDSAPARVVRMVGFDKRVLEIGAGPGSISRVLTRTSRCRVTALELDEAVIPLLEGSCERVHRADLNSTSWPENLLNEEKFDVVVAADVLEHLYDPRSVLEQAKSLIDDNGYIVASLPHAGYHGVLASLLDENFEYRSNGLLDQGHIRFFGVKNIQALFDDAGLGIVDAEFVIRLPEDTEFARVWGKTPPTARTALLGNRYGFVYQVVVRVVPIQSTTRMISLLELSPGGFTEDPVRVTSPETGDGAPAESTSGQPHPPEDSRGDRNRESSGSELRLIAFYLPQFHPIPENDKWWGKGFTEWTNATQAEPLFDGHYQPHLPADLGFYDLRVSEVRHEQIALARQHGVDGFCYHYYWFSGTRILNRPLDAMMNDPLSDMPFCLCWANENWTRRWDGVDDDVLIGQQYLPDDDLNFIRSMVPFFRDSRYIKLHGAPFLIVYQPQDLPDPPKSVRIWREHCASVGIGDIHLCAALTNESEDYSLFGFDSGVQFPPHNQNCGGVNEEIDFHTPFHGKVVEYEDLAQAYLDRRYPHSNVFRTVVPMWDQTPRVGSRAFITLNGTPANYEFWLAESLRRTRHDFPAEERFVFINAWNEWAEGCHIEPDRRFGRGFLEATFCAKTNQSSKRSFEDVGLPEVAGPFTGLSARVESLKHELSIDRERQDALEHELQNERQRLSDVYKDLSAQRERLAAARQEFSVEWQQSLAAREELSTGRKRLETLERKLSINEQRLLAATKQLDVERSFQSSGNTGFLKRVSNFWNRKPGLSGPTGAQQKAMLVERNMKIARVVSEPGTPANAFESYYDEHFLPLHDYFDIHKLRFLHSFEILYPLVAPGSVVADLGGRGPLAVFFSADRGSNLIDVKTDLREPFDVESECCDWVICTEVIEHIKDKNSTEISELEAFNYSGVNNILSESARILRPGGKIFITTPNAASFTSLYKWLYGELPYMDPNHVREFTVDLLNEVCLKSGLELDMLDMKNSWCSVPIEALAQLERLVMSFPVKRDISRAENIYAIYRKHP